MTISTYLDDAAKAIRATVSPETEKNIAAAIDAIVAALREDNPLLVCGNGGSASDAMHIAGELVGRFLAERRALNCICLSSNPSVLTAWSNDYSYETVFSRQVEAYGRLGGVLLGLSTSGNSKNMVQAAIAAKKKGITVISLTGEGGGKLAAHSNILLAVPARETPVIQQVHICLYHYLCQEVERRMLD